MMLSQIVARELHQMFVVDKRRAVFVLVASLAYMVLFGFLYSTHSINAVPIVILDEDQTQFSRTLIQALDDSERFRIVQYPSTQEEMEQALNNKEALAAVQIPANFARDVKSNRSSTVMLMVNGANILIANTVSTTAQEIISSFSKVAGTSLSESILSQLPIVANNKTSPIELRFRILNNPTQSYLPFFVLGLAMAAIQQGIFLSVGASIHGEFKDQTALPYFRSWTALAGKLVPYLSFAALSFIITLEVGIHLFQIPEKSSAFSILLLGLSFMFCAVSFSALIATVCDTELTFDRLSIAYSVPAFVMSGYTWPQDAMDEVGQVLSCLFPLSYFSNTLRELMLAGYSASLYRNSATLVLIGTVSFYFTTIVFGKKCKNMKSCHMPISKQGDFDIIGNR